MDAFGTSTKDAKRATIPKSNTTYWIPKLTRNVEKYKQNIKELLSDGWRVFTIWECEVKEKQNLENLVLEIKK